MFVSAVTSLGRVLDQVERGVRVLRRVDHTYIALRSPRKTVRRFDADLRAAIVTRRRPGIDRCAWIGTQLGSWVTHVGVMGSTAVLTLRSGSRRPLVYAIVSMSGASAIYTGLKHTIRRGRPAGYEHLVTVRDPSFPSGHSATAAAAARTLAEIHGLPKFPLALVSTIVPITRVYLGVHHPSDVIAGWLIGWSWASLMAVVIKPGMGLDPDTDTIGETAVDISTADDGGPPEPPEPDDVDDSDTAPVTRLDRSPSTRNHPSTG